MIDLQDVIEKREFIKEFLDELNKRNDFMYEDVIAPVDGRIDEIIKIILKKKNEGFERVKKLHDDFYA